VLDSAALAATVPQVWRSRYRLPISAEGRAPWLVSSRSRLSRIIAGPNRRCGIHATQQNQLAPFELQKALDSARLNLGMAVALGDVTSVSLYQSV
jgi:hypothetical protein